MVSRRASLLSPCLLPVTELGLVPLCSQLSLSSLASSVDESSSASASRSKKGVFARLQASTSSMISQRKRPKLRFALPVPLCLASLRKIRCSLLLVPLCLIFK